MESSDSLKVTQKEDGRYQLEWDKNDPKWKWLNRLTPEQIQGIIREAVTMDHRGAL